MQVSLRPLQTSDYSFLYELRSDPESLHLWERDAVPTQSAYYRELDAFSQRKEEVLMVVIAGEDPRPVGMVFTLGTNLHDRHTFVAGILAREYRGRLIGANGLEQFLIHLFAALPLHKVYADIVEYNQASLGLVRKLNFSQEGFFKQHRFYKGQLWGCYRYAFYKDQIMKPGSQT